jgi:PAS domain S-box-containing protein
MSVKHLREICAIIVASCGPAVKFSNECGGPRDREEQMMPSDIRTALGTHLLRDALDATADPVEINDLDGRIVSVNDAWCRLFCRTREHVMGTPWESTATNGLDVSELRRCWVQCQATGHSGGVIDLGRADGLVSRVSFARWLCWDPREGGDAVVTIYKPLSDNTGAQGTAP